MTSLAPSQTTRPNTLVTWAYAPDWLTVEQAAKLLGRDYTPEAILELIELGAVTAKADGRSWLVDKQALREYREVLWEVLTDGWED